MAGRRLYVRIPRPRLKHPQHMTTSIMWMGAHPLHFGQLIGKLESPFCLDQLIGRSAYDLMARKSARPIDMLEGRDACILIARCECRLGIDDSRMTAARRQPRYDALITSKWAMVKTIASYGHPVLESKRPQRGTYGERLCQSTDAAESRVRNSTSGLTVPKYARLIISTCSPISNAAPTPWSSREFVQSREHLGGFRSSVLIQDRGIVDRTASTCRPGDSKRAAYRSALFPQNRTTSKEHRKRLILGDIAHSMAKRRLPLARLRYPSCLSTGSN